MFKTIPGSIGYPIVSDKSYEFLRDPVKFLDKNMETTSSKIFQTRILNNPTVCICCPHLIKQLLGEKSNDFEHGYRSILHRVYGDLLLFEDEPKAFHLRECLVPMFEEHEKFHEKTQKICNSFIASLEGKMGSISVYTEFKSLMTRVCLELFLDLDKKKSFCEMNAISDLATQHWHGIISLPIQINIPFKGQSSFKVAVEAKDKLLEHISIILKHHDPDKEDSLLSQLMKVVFPKKNDLEQHLLLFTSALIPKAFSSLITSFLIVMSGDEMSSVRDKARGSRIYLEYVLLEVERLWPPLFAGRRLAKCTTNIGSYTIPKDYAVFYMIYAANRDPDVFPNPHKFNPDRWSTSNKDDRHLVLTYGSGRRCCIGTKFIHSIILDVMNQLLQSYDWCICPCNQDIAYKYLPVARPESDVNIEFYQH